MSRPKTAFAQKHIKDAATAVSGLAPYRYMQRITKRIFKAGLGIAGGPRGLCVGGIAGGSAVPSATLAGSLAATITRTFTRLTGEMFGQVLATVDAVASARVLPRTLASADGRCRGSLLRRTGRQRRGSLRFVNGQWT